MTPGGSCTSTFTVPLSLRSVGTLSADLHEPAGRRGGGLHGDVRRTRRRAAAGRAPRRRQEWRCACGGTPSSDRDLEAGAELVEVRDAGDDLEPPVAGRGQRRAEIT